MTILSPGKKLDDRSLKYEAGVQTAQLVHPVQYGPSKYISSFPQICVQLECKNCNSSTNINKKKINMMVMRWTIVYKQIQI
jgi:hypothetical protein